MATSLLSIFLSCSFSSSYFALKVTLLSFFFVAILNRIQKQLSFSFNLQKNQIWKQPKDLKTFDIIWDKKGKKVFKSNFELHDKKSFRGPSILFDLNDF